MDNNKFLIKFEGHVQKMLESTKITKKTIIENLNNGDCPFMYDDLIMHYLYLSRKGTIQRSHRFEPNIDEEFLKCCKYLKQNKNLIPDMLKIINTIEN